MSENLRSTDEIKKAIRDYMTLSIQEFGVQYNIKTGDEARGFVKGLRWTLRLS